MEENKKTACDLERQHCSPCMASKIAVVALVVMVLFEWLGK